MKVNNSFIQFFFNKFDFIIRFAYTQLGFISKLIHKLLFWNLYSSNFEVVFENFAEMRTYVEKHKVNFKEKMILELGPGNSGLNAFNFLVFGAKKVYFLDKFPKVFDTPKQKEFEQKEFEFIKKKYPQSDFYFYDNGFKPQYFQYIANTLEGETILKNIDFIYSKSVLEHIREIETSINKMFKLLNSGGYMYHKIDLRDHYNFNKPFLFYKYSDKQWNSLLTKEGMSYTNRVRCNEFVELFTNAGFEIIELETLNYAQDFPELNEKFSGRKDLAVGMMKILLRKP